MSKKYIVTIPDGIGELAPCHFYIDVSDIRPYRTPFDMITEFHKANGQPAPESPTLLSPYFQALRYKLHSEELLTEYPEAVAECDLVKIADALCDTVYVVIGSAVGHGFTRFDEMFAEVHASNMSKLGADGKPVLRDDGKVLKGPNFFQPNLRKFMK